MEDKTEKIKEKIINSRENKGMEREKKEAIRLLIRPIIMEKVGNKNKLEA
jgi:hypothetical protein